MEIGCGTGLLSLLLLDELAYVVGQDVSEGMVKVFANKISQHPRKDDMLALHLDLAQVDALKGADTQAQAKTQLPLGSFDLIFSQFVLHHVANVEEVISAFSHYLRPGGRVILIDFERTENAERFHPLGFQVGKELERHGLTEEEITTWVTNTGRFEQIQLQKTKFMKNVGDGHLPKQEEEFSLLFLTALAK
eukprot:TRINITY_DN2104_c0_g1_i2.p1 TRINITY_DN2104_c0_g1~~TRINITY_DN2104_c0_g1_i2.p1  ORF type:complete len:192 (-),score=26.51 TRINITY_DN2104_c0_g1_i2:347-922(-)